MACNPRYIDHAFLTCGDKNILDGCRILCDNDYLSDHLPVKTTLHIDWKISSHKPTNDNINIQNIVNVNWTNANAREKYAETLNNLCLALPVDPSPVDVDTAQVLVNNTYSNIVQAVSQACEGTIECSASCSKNGQPSLRSVPWWSADCSLTRDRQRFWHRLWVSCGRPRQGQVYSCYKYVKSVYRKTCRQAFNNNIQHGFNYINSLYASRNTKQFWKHIRHIRNCNNDSSDYITLDALTDYFENKFSHTPDETVDMVKCNDHVQIKTALLEKVVYNKTITTDKMCDLIKKLKRGCAPGPDKTLAEHFFYGVHTALVPVLCHLFSTCIQFGVLPQNLRHGTLLPIIKKPGADATVPKNWRPITLSNTIGKLLEIYIMDECVQSSLDDSQYGFVKGRGTEMATSIIHDVIVHSVAHGSPVYTCSLDAEGAFDRIPHNVLLSTADGTIPDHCWRLLNTWYHDMHVSVRFRGASSKHIPINIGTKQGGITSPLLFNLFYRQLIEKLNKIDCGIKACGVSFNVFCYADDVLLTSLTITGLQKLINAANEFIRSYGMSFNASKTVCKTFGKCTLIDKPAWSLNNTLLKESEVLSYLGTNLAETSQSHVHERIRKTRRAFYSLQPAGLCPHGVSPSVTAHLWNLAVRPVLMYGCATIFVDKTRLSELEKTQSLLIKTSLGLPKCCKHSDLLAALGIPKVSTSLVISHLNIFKRSILNSVKARTFYLNLSRSGNMIKNMMISTVLEHAREYDINILRFLIDDAYSKTVNNNLKRKTVSGVTDTINYLLHDFNDQNQELLKLLLLPF